MTSGEKPSHTGGRGDQEGQAEVDQEAHGSEDHAGQASQSIGGSIEDVDVEAGASHEDGDTTGESDDEDNGHHVGSAGDEGVDDLLLGQATDDTDQDTD